MSAVLAPPAPPAAGASDTAAGTTVRGFLTGFAWALGVPVVALGGLFAGWTVLAGAGWPAAVAAVAGWSVGVVAWLRHRRWPAGRAHLVSWVGPGALLVPLAAVGALSADALVVWGPVGAVLAIALAAVHDPELVGLPTR